MHAASNIDRKDAAKTSSHGVFEQLRFLMPFWVAPDQKWKARLMLGSIIGLSLAEIALTAAIGFGFQAGLNALVAKDIAVFAMSGAATVTAMSAAIFAGNSRDYIALNLGQNWRGWLTRKFNDAWLKDKTCWKLKQSKSHNQNPDHLIAETIPSVTTQTVQLGLALFRSVVSLVTFSVLLWNISPLMVGVAVTCAAGAHAATHWIGRSIGNVWKKIMDCDAKFRHALMRVRDNAKSIALSGLERVEKETLTEAFNSTDARHREFYKVNFLTNIVSSFNMSTASIVPIAMTAPQFFAGTATLGGLELTRQIYNQFYGALNWFPQGYAAIASWSVSVNQLMDFHKELEENKLDITKQAPPPKSNPAAPKPPAGPKP